MTNTAILTGLYELKNDLQGDEKRAYEYAMSHEEVRESQYATGIGMKLAKLIYNLEKEMKEKDYSKGGKAKTISAIKRILKTVPEYHKSLKGVLKYENCSIVCDGFRAVRFYGAKKDIPFEECEYAFDMPKKINDIVIATMQGANSVNIMPTLAEVKSVIEIEKARRKASGEKINGYKPIVYKLNENTWVNAEYLKDVMEATEAFALHVKETDAPVNRNAVYILGEDADGILLPINH